MRCLNGGLRIIQIYQLFYKDDDCHVPRNSGIVSLVRSDCIRSRSQRVNCYWNVFLYFLIEIITITLFTILDVNFQWVSLTRKVEGSFAMYISRSIVIPLPILLAVCVLNSNLKAKWRSVLTALILIFLCLADRIYLWADLLTYRRWNQFSSALMYGVFILLTLWIGRWFIGLDKGE
mgnify:CR=1 FL=1